MSSIPNPPPPPPPPQPAPPLPPPGQKCSSLVKGFVGQSPCDSEPLVLGQTETKFVSEEEFIAQLCDLVSSRIGDVSSADNDGKVVLAVVTPLERKILQNGPMCGIVALAEAIELLPSKRTCEDEKVSPKTTLEKAIELGYTKQGEMFSVEKMKSLANLFGANCEDSRILDFGKGPSADNENEKYIQQEILQHVVDGYPALFPYDADFNHSPSLRKGHAAHWAVIHGLVFPISLDKLTLAVKQSFQTANQSSQQGPLVILKPNRASKILDKSDIEEFLKHLDYDLVHVVAHQGKSFRTALWKFKDLLESNRNLVEMSPKILDHRENFIFDDIQEGLCSKILLLK